jgi:hypothetical protein
VGHGDDGGCTLLLYFALDEFVSKVVACQLLMGGSIEFS